MSFLLHVFIINLLVISPCPYLPVFIYNIIGETLTSNTHRAIISEYWASLLRLRNITNKSESSNYTANGDLAIKSGFVNVVSSAILNSQAGTAVHSFPDSRSPFPVPSFSNIPQTWKSRMLLVSRSYRPDRFALRILFTVSRSPNFQELLLCFCNKNLVEIYRLNVNPRVPSKHSLIACSRTSHYFLSAVANKPGSYRSSSKSNADNFRRINMIRTKLPLIRSNTQRPNVVSVLSDFLHQGSL